MSVTVKSRLETILNSDTERHGQRGGTAPHVSGTPVDTPGNKRRSQLEAMSEVKLLIKTMSSDDKDVGGREDECQTASRTGTRPVVTPGNKRRSELERCPVKLAIKH